MDIQCCDGHEMYASFRNGNDKTTEFQRKMNAF